MSKWKEAFDDSGVGNFSFIWCLDNFSLMCQDECIGLNIGIQVDSAYQRLKSVSFVAHVMDGYPI